ncbi:MAG: hypothetical protein LBU83_08785 [Bacteroidales bacterium]|nr:hypothetical protein [Bacteroidales bacterium]
MDDPDIADEPSALKEIHAIRLRIYDETKDLTFEERAAYFRKGAERFFAQRDAVAAIV